MAALGLAPPLAIVAASSFASAALYVSCVEHPARGELTDDEALRQWKPSYRRAARLQGGLAIVAALLGLHMWRSATSATGGAPLWAAGAAAAALNWPFTLIFILPTNKRLLGATKGSSTTRTLLRRWGRLHAVRVCLGWAAAAAYTLAVSRAHVRKDWLWM